MTITEPTIKKLRFDQLVVDHSVQRVLNEAKAAKIGENYKPEAVGVLVVSHREDDSYHVMDGQTRRAGAMYAGHAEDLVDCQVYEDLTRSEEAAMFRLLNDRNSVGPIDKFLVRTVEREPVAVDICSVLTRHGWMVSHARNNGKVQAVGALEAVYKQAEKIDRDHAMVTLRTTVDMITNAYGHDPDGMRAEIIQGLGAIVAAHRTEADLPKLMRAMSQYEGGPLALIGRCKGLREMRGGRIADNMADVMVNLHNKNKQVGRLPGWRSE